MKQPTCETCLYWTPPLKDWRGRPVLDGFGECQKAGWGSDFRVEGPSGCHECVPYGVSSQELWTKPTFSCSAHEVKP